MSERFPMRGLATALAALSLLSGCAYPAPSSSPAADGSSVPEASHALPPDAAYMPSAAPFVSAFLSASSSIVSVSLAGCDGSISHGTAFFLGDGMLLTSAGLVEGAQEVLVRPAGMDPARASIISLLPASSLALLSVPSSLPSPPALGWLEPDLVEEGMPLLAVHHASPSSPPAAASGIVSSASRSEGVPVAVFADLSLPLSAGAPLLSASGLVVGVVLDAAPSPLGAYAVTYASLEEDLYLALSGDAFLPPPCEGPGFLEVGMVLQDMCAKGSVWACMELGLRVDLLGLPLDLPLDLPRGCPDESPSCFDALAPSRLGDDPVLDSLAEACVDEGSAWLDACSLLASLAPSGSDYAVIAVTCGGRTMPSVRCGDV